MTQTKYRKRGSLLMLIIVLAALIAVTAYLIISLKNTPAAAQEVAAEQVEATEEKSIDDEVAATTLIHAGDVAPDFSVVMLDGSNVTLSALQGKPTLLIFWATWCPPCREELAHLQEGVIDVYGDKINVLPVSRGEKHEVVEEYITKMGYTFAVGLDGEQEAYRKYATNYIPRCFVIDSNGTVVYSGVGYDESIAGEVKAALDKSLL
ncbi:MAG: TlpA family protein disulfide reductase [Alistipes sp.]|nr:TlpA family protein disulfide reductase [Alistipes sp.]